MRHRRSNRTGARAGDRLVGLVVAGLIALAASVAAAADSARVGVPPGNPPEAEGTGGPPGIFKVTLTVEEGVPINLGNGVTAKATTYNGTVPGPTFRVKKGQRVQATVVNNLNELSTGAHWHGVEVTNQSDGSGVTQNQIKPGEQFLYDFIPTREGLFWYHPHFSPTNAEFRGQYGMFIVEGPINDGLVRRGVIPGRKHTRVLVLGDTTVCKQVLSNDPDTFPSDATLPWSGNELEPPEDFQGQSAGRGPEQLCEQAQDDEGNGGQPNFAKGDIPNIQPKFGCPGPSDCRTNEGQLVLVNGVVPAPRAGKPTNPGALDPGPGVVDVHSGEGWRLQMVNTAVTRYFRLRLTDDSGSQITLFRIGGQGGLLDKPRIEGGSTATFDTRYKQGEIVLAPGERADVVFKVPAGQVGDVLTLWTQDYDRVGSGPGTFPGPGPLGNFSFTPTVPVAHFRLAEGEREQAREFSISTSTVLRTGANLTENIKNDTLQPLAPIPAGEVGQLVDPEIIRLTISNPGRAQIDGIATPELHHGSDDFDNPLVLSSSFPVTRYAHLGTTVELRWKNETNADHPMHLHGFSFQPVKILDPTDTEVFTFNYREFIDTINVPAQHTIIFRVRFDDRPKPNGSPGGGLGRWVLHCHIFFHAGLGMNAEIQVLEDPNAAPVAVAAPVRRVSGAARPATVHRH